LAIDLGLHVFRKPADRPGGDHGGQLGWRVGIRRRLRADQGRRIAPHCRCAPGLHAHSCGDYGIAQSQVVDELSPVSFTVNATGNPPPTFQWHRDGAKIPAATDPSYALAAAALIDNGARFHVVAANVISNVTHSATSSVATLTVLADLKPPVLLSARATGLGQVQVEFSERIALVTATNLAHYTLMGPNGAVAIVEAALDSTEDHVVLNVGTLVENGTYTLAVEGLTDLAAAANRIGPGSQVTFQALGYTAEDIGAPSIQGSVKAVPGGVDVTGGGTAIGGAADQFQFSYVMRAGDFDVRYGWPRSRCRTLGLRAA